MSALFVLLIASLGVATGFLAAFIWAVKSGQFDDTLTPSMRVLGDDEPAKKSGLKKRKHDIEPSEETERNLDQQEIP